MWVDQMVDQFSTYIYQKRGFYYFSKRIPKQLQHCHGKQRIVFALNTRSRAKAVKYAQVICQRLDERWLPMRLDAMGLGNVLANDVTSSDAPKLSEALQLSAAERRRQAQDLPSSSSAKRRCGY